MADIIISIVAKVVEYLVGPAIRKGKYFLCVSKVIKDLENEKEELISERNNLQDRVEQAKERTELIEEPVEKWLNDVKDLLDEIADLEQRMRSNISCFQGRCPTWRKYRLCKQMAEKIEAMEKFKGKSNNIQPFSHRAPLPGIQYQSSESFSCFEPTKMAYNQLMEALQDDCNYIIGVYGMGGCGKTTLVTEVGKKAEESKMFDKVMLITVSQTPNIRDIQGKMADMLNLKLEEETEDGRAQRLWLSLKEKKRILLIVDDLWRKFNLEKIGIPLDNVKRGAWKILITTRDRHICTSMDCQKSIHVGLLSKDESWTLFRKHAKIDYKFSESLDGVPQKLCDECKGLLIAIVSVGSSLKGRPQSDWELALDKLRDLEAFDDHEEGVRDALRCLKLSYDISIIASLTRLEVLDLQSCLFNELPDEIGKLKRLKLLNLSNCGILQKNYNGAIGKCSELEELYASHYWQEPEEYISQSIVDIVTLPKLQRFVIGTIPDTMRHCLSRSMRLLEVRDFNISKLRASKKNILQIAEVVYLEGLHGGYKNIVPDVIGVVGAMNDLNTLYLRECLEIECIFNTSADSKVDDLIPRLVNLIIMQMENLKELCRGPPLQALHFFEKIKSLRIQRCMSLHSIFPRECTLRNLKSLTIMECESVEVLLSTPAAQSLQQLEDLHIWGCDVLKHIIASGTEHGCNTSREIVSAPTSSHLPMPNLKSVHIDRCPKLESIFPMCYVEGLRRLEEMYIKKSPELKYVFDECDDEHRSSHQYENHILLPHLQLLQLVDLRNLIGMCPEYCHAKWPSRSLKKITVMDGSDQRQHPLDENLTTLPQLKLYGLPQLNFLQWASPTPGQIWSLQCLRRLIVDKCEKLKSLFSMEVCRSLPELMSLSIDHCPELEQIVAANELVQLSNAEVYFPKLHHISIGNCNKLKSLFPVAMVRMLPQLKILKIFKATQLEEVFCHNSGDDTIDEMEIVLPNLTGLRLEDLLSFVDICHGCELHAMKLQHLRINGCPKTSPSLRAMQTNEEEDEDSLDDDEL